MVGSNPTSSADKSTAVAVYSALLGILPGSDESLRPLLDGCMFSKMPVNTPECISTD